MKLKKEEYKRHIIEETEEAKETTITCELAVNKQRQLAMVSLSLSLCLSLSLSLRGHGTLLSIKGTRENALVSPLPT